ncbi:MAG TPA: thioredoxin family protein [Chthoniobacterales bacterium]|nr:thioredoxin family protein [Chthoniobacterales bacterium]
MSLLVLSKARDYLRAMFNRKLCLGALLICLTSGSFAAAGWETDYEKALVKAKAENKSVFLEFTGSDWCGPCIDFRKRVLSSKEFAGYAAKNLVLVEIDFPQRKKQSSELKKQNEKVGRQYGIDEKGFPTIVLLDSAGKVIREFTGYDGEPSTEIIAWIEGKKKM